MHGVRALSGKDERGVKSEGNEGGDGGKRKWESLGALVKDNKIMAWAVQEVRRGRMKRLQVTNLESSHACQALAAMQATVAPSPAPSCVLVLGCVLSAVGLWWRTTSPELVLRGEKRPGPPPAQRTVRDSVCQCDWSDQTANLHLY